MQRFQPDKLRYSRYGLGFLLMLLLACLWLVLSQPRALPQLQQLNIAAWCDGRQFSSLPADFSAAACQQAKTTPDPQGQLLWLQLPFELPRQATTEPAAPLALFIYARAASAVYLNGQLIGQNGRPGLVADEQPGLMDSRFYLPAALLKPGHNQIVLQMSAQHGWFRLAQPIHFIGIGPYNDAKIHLQQHKELGLVLLGILLTGLLYFSVLALRTQSSALVPANPQRMPQSMSQRLPDALLALLCLFAAGQLWLEMTRALFGYLYPLHDLRLLAILCCAGGFGFSLLLLTAFRYQRRYWQWWLLATVLLTLPLLGWLDGFDSRIAVATLLPTAMAALLAGFSWFFADNTEQPEVEGAGISAVLLLLYVAAALLLSGIFQEILAFVLVTLLLCALFIEQALQRQQQQQQQLADQQLILQLQSQLGQNQLGQNTRAEPEASLTLNSAGKVQLLPLDDIAYCQAARDYSEIWLLDGRQQLYSGTLRALEQQLPARFIRVHRSYLVNVRHVRQFCTTADSDSGSAAVLLLMGGQQVPVSRRLIPAVRSAMQEQVAA